MMEPTIITSLEPALRKSLSTVNKNINKQYKDLVMKVFIFGKNGMLGNTMCLFLKESFSIVELGRNDFNPLLHSVDELHELLNKYSFQKDDIVINCMGLIPQRNELNMNHYHSINTVFPNSLAEVVSKLNGHLIQISTNCVFPSSSTPFDETVIPTAEDIYGTSKFLGEPPTASVIRTSIIGEEKGVGVSLLNWALSSTQDINGYTNHLWNGVTCLQLAKYIQRIIETQNFWKGVRHIHSSETLSKFELLKMIVEIYDKKINVIPMSTDKPVSKLLISNYPSLLEIPSLYQQIVEQKLFFQVQKIKQGEIIKQTHCRFCETPTQTWYQFQGMYPLAGGFLRERDLESDCKVPLTIDVCHECQLLQCREVISSDTLFKKGYFYFSSMIPFLVSHFKEFAEFLHREYGVPGQKKLVLEIGCNDGVLLRRLQGDQFETIGVDPSHTVSSLLKDGFTIYNDYFSKEIAQRIIDKHGKVDIFLSSNSFAHIHDMKNILDGIQLILKPNGVAIIEVHNSLNILRNLNFEFIYHEHMTYYTKTSFAKIFERIGMSVEKIEDIDVHGGSMRVFLRNSATQESFTSSLLSDSQEFYHYLNEFPSLLKKWKQDFQTLYYSLKKEGKRIIGYGASGRANMFLRFLDIELDGIVDDAESKIGAYMPLLHTRIEASSSIYTTLRPDYIVLISWAYKDMILEKHKQYLETGGKFIIPLPFIDIIEKYKAQEDILL